MKTDFKTLTVVQSPDGVVQLVLNRPEARNAISHEMMAELDAALDAAELDDDVLAVVLRGEGKLFSAGHDLKEQGTTPFHMEVFPNASPSVPPTLPRPWYFRKPLIGAVHGYVGPYAFALVACCDFNIAADGTRFSCEVFRGSSPGVEWLPLYFQLPMRVIEKLWLMGGWMDAAQALQFQFVQRVVPEGDVVDEATRWARHAAQINPAGFMRGKDRIRRSIEAIGLNALAPVLAQHPDAMPVDRRRSELSSSIEEKGLQETMRSRREGVDPEITKV